MPFYLKGVVMGYVLDWSEDERTEKYLNDRYGLFGKITADRIEKGEDRELDWEEE